MDNMASGRRSIFVDQLASAVARRPICLTSATYISWLKHSATAIAASLVTGGDNVSRLITTAVGPRSSGALQRPSVSRRRKLTHTDLYPIDWPAVELCSV